jgi:hypothetical protein
MIKKIEAFKTSDGMLFTDELEAYKHECIYLDKIANGVINKFITRNGIDIDYKKYYTIKQLLPCLSISRCDIPHSPGCYMWFNTAEQMGYIGSTEDLFSRCSDFLRFNTRYSGEKIENARKEHKDDFVYLILEETKDVDTLINLESFYIKKYDTIKNGYNTKQAHENPLRTSKKCTKEEKEQKQRIKNAKSTFDTILKNIKEWGMKVGETLTFEKWFESYDVGRIYNFRIPCFMESTNVVEFSSLMELGNTMKMYLDKPHYGYRTETDAFPSTMIRYRQSDERYLAIGNDSRVFMNPKDALTYYVEEHIRTKIITLLTRCNDNDTKDKVYEYIKNASFYDLIRLKYKDCEKIINYFDSEPKQQKA